MSCQRQILVVEDEPDLRETIKTLLELEGYRVTAVGNGLAALKMLQSGEEVCLILLDLMMPVMDGWQLLETLRRDHEEILQSTPIVVVSAAADLSPVQEKYGLQVLNKPARINSLLAVADAHCKGGPS